MQFGLQYSLELGTSLELDSLCGRDLDLGLGLGVYACAGCPLTYAEGSESDELYCITLLEGNLYGFHEGVEGLFRIFLGQSGVLSDGLDQF